MSAYVGLSKPKGPKGSRLRKGEVFAYVGRNQNLKDLKFGTVDSSQGQIWVLA